MLASLAAALIIFEKTRFHRNLSLNKLHFKLNEQAFEALGRKFTEEPDVKNVHYCPYEDCYDPGYDSTSEQNSFTKEADEKFAAVLKNLNYPGLVWAEQLETGSVVIPNIESYFIDKYVVYAEWKFWPNGVPKLLSCISSPIAKAKMKCSEKLSDTWTLNYVWYDITIASEY